MYDFFFFLFFPSYIAQELTVVWGGNSYMLMLYRNVHPLPPSLLFKCFLAVAIPYLVFAKG